MTRRDKLVDKIRARPSQMGFADVKTLLGVFGWELDRQTGSHVTFIKDGERSISFPKVGGRHVKGIYLDQICIRLGLDD